MRGFFPKSEGAVLEKPTLQARCGLCKLYRSCQTPKMKVDGRGRRSILVIGESPGRNEDAAGRPFVGKAGSYLKDGLAEVGIDLRKDCWVTNAIICHAEYPSGANRNPTDKEIDHCRPNVINAIKELQPERILLLGASAVKSVIGWLWKEDVGPLHRWLGWRIPVQKVNAWVTPAWHPSYLQRGEGQDNDAVRAFWIEQLRQGTKGEGRPWEVVPDYKSKVRVEKNPVLVAEQLCRFVNAGRAVAFDFETDRLKPDHPDASIYCCAVSDGETTLAYPWVGKAVEASKALLESDVPKIGWHMKFEHRWARAQGVRIPDSSWIHDGMLAAHVLDNRPLICGLKFQAFVKVGQDSYDGSVKGYLKAKSSNEKNRIYEAPQDQILRYCGLDALLEWEIAQIQMRELNRMAKWQEKNCVGID